MASILVTGASGYIGGRLVPRLLDMGHSIRCLARHPEALEGRNWENTEILQGDVLDLLSLEKAMRGIDVAYYLVHSMRAGEHDFREKDREAAKNFGSAAKNAGVRQIVYLGGLGSSASGMSPHLESRQEVGNVLRMSGVDVTEFRAAIIVGSGSISFEMIRYLTERLPVMICPRWVKSRCQPISIRDVLQYLVAAPETEKARGQILEIGGKDVLSYREMMLGYAKLRGLRRWILEVPVLTPRLSSYWVDLVTPIPSSISRPLIEGLRHDVVCQDHRALEIFPHIHPLPYLESLRLALDRVEQNRVETIWSDSHASLGLRQPAPYRLESREGLIREIQEIDIKAPASRVFDVISSIGGHQGWYRGNWLWKIRGGIDRLLGGIGMRRGRRDPRALKPGDAVDFWRVEEIQPGRLLRLRAEMKIPGKAWLQFEVEPDPSGEDRSRLVQTAFYEPRGLTGWLYWYLLYPVHRALFPALSREIARRSEN